MDTQARIKYIQKKTKSIKSYLEIGVSEGATFNALSFDLKVAVDPHFKFDFESLETDHINFFQMTSDDYFINSSSSNKFDLIFLDGLHEYKQTTRDFLNVLVRSHDKSIIIIDDVYPYDVFSSLLKHSKVLEYRKMNQPESENLAWNGDIFKTIAFIHDLCPFMTFKTIDKGYGNPQTYCYRKTRKEFSPKFSSLEEIDRLTYFDLLENKSFLNLASEAEVLDEIVAFLND